MDMVVETTRVTGEGVSLF